MRRIFLIWMLLAGLTSVGLWAQKTPAGERCCGFAQPEIVEVVRYAQPAGKGKTWLQMAFADSRIQNPEAWAPDGQEVHQVDIVLTRFPHAVESWEIGYDKLMLARYQAVCDLVPGLADADSIQWRIVLQTGARHLEAAKRMQHGVTLYHRPVVEADSKRAVRYPLAKLEENLDLVHQIVAGKAAYRDSTALTIVDQHSEWKSMLLVVDWTASMYQQGAQLVRWHQENERDAIRHFVFFNDGDGKYDDEKVAGETGGIYSTEGTSTEEIEEVLEAVTLGGEGGDHRENDLEAVLFALNNYFDFEDVVLVADNGGPVRGMHLLPEIDRPMQIVLCGVYKDNIEPDYLTIAYHTGSTIHTRDFVLKDIANQLVHGVLTLGENEYELRGKRFVRKRKEW